MISNLSIRQKIFWLLLSVNLVTAVTYTWFSYRAEVRLLLEGIDRELTAAAAAVPLILPADYHDRATGPGTIPVDEFVRVEARLTDYAGRLGLAYVYSYVQLDERIYNTSTSRTADERRMGLHNVFFDSYDEASAAMRATFADGRSRAESYTDRYGNFRSVFISRSSAGGNRYLVGADRPLEFVNAARRRTLMRSALLGLIIFLLVFIASSVLSDQLSRRILRLSRYAQDLAASEFAGSDELRREVDRLAERGRDEVGRLASSFRFMERKLAEYLVDLRSTTAAKERIETEMKLAGEIQTSLLPQLEPPYRGDRRFDLDARMKTARQAGGDLYDFFFLDPARLCVVVGDVSDKGMPAALFMAVTLTLLRSIAARAPSLAAAFTALNTQLARNNETMQFVTLAGLVLDLGSGAGEYCDGGHGAPYVIDRVGAVRRLERTPNLALGALEDVDFPSREVRLAPGDTVLFYTDGVTEAMNGAGELYGEARLVALLAADLAAGAAPAAPADLLTRVQADVAAFCGDQPMADDLTLLAVRWRAPEAPAD